MTPSQLDALVAAALLHLRRSLGTSAGIHLAKVRAEFARVRREMGVV